MIFTDRPYQTQADQSLFDYFATHPVGNPVIAMPTGTGKAVVIARFVQRVLTSWPSQRIMMLTDVKELVDQNAKKLLALWPQAPLGLYSAGLKQKQASMPITFASVQSAAKNPHLFGRQDLLIIDECHMVSEKDTTSYQKLIAFLKKGNPNLRVIGLSATIYRLGLGMITDNGIFTDVCYDITSKAAFNRLIDDGYLSPLIPMQTQTILDIANVKKQGGEFIATQLQAAVNKREVTIRALAEAQYAARDRAHILVFSTGIDHARDIVEVLRDMGESAACIHSKMDPAIDGTRDANLAAFLSGEIRWLVNADILTKGFDFPALDCIVLLRPTNSVVLHVQILGRGTRPFYVNPMMGHNGAPLFDLSTTEGRLAAMAAGPKQNCLVLDFANNTRRLGPINDPQIPRKKGEGTGEIPVKVCICGCLNHISAITCANCGEPFDFKVKIEAKASTIDLIVRDQPQVEMFNVDRVSYAAHVKPGKPPTLKVSYYCGMRRFTEWVCLEHHGNPILTKAHAWWAERSPWPAPQTIAEVIAYLGQHPDALKIPRRIRVHVNTKYPEILFHEFEQVPNPAGAGQREAVA